MRSSGALLKLATKFFHSEISKFHEFSQEKLGTFLSPLYGHPLFIQGEVTPQFHAGTPGEPAEMRRKGAGRWKQGVALENSA